MDSVATEISCKTEENINSTTRESKCNICKKEFFHNDILYHVCTPPKQKKITSVCHKGQTNKKTTTTDFQKRKEKSKFVCEICNKVLSRRPTLINHYRSCHTGERAFPCDVCGKCFISSTFLKVHSRYHAAEKLFKCDICPRVFLSKKKLDEHHLTHFNHAGERKFKCEFCERSFINSSSLKYHCSTHVGEKKFSCKFCNKAFKQESSLINHYAVHAKQPSPSKCDENIEQGESVENTKKNLFDLLPKKMFRCLLCKKCFGTQKRMEKHFLCHTSKRSFVCPVCKTAFKSKQTLVRHYRFHTREKPYKCDLCDKEFYDQKDLKDHIILNHDSEKQP